MFSLNKTKIVVVCLGLYGCYKYFTSPKKNSNDLPKSMLSPIHTIEYGESSLKSLDDIDTIKFIKSSIH